VYDVSRWGRFQDVDESAFYEHLCRRAGVSLIYCAEQFADGGTPMSALMKNIKRIMAAECSWELGEKVLRAQSSFACMVASRVAAGFRPVTCGCQRRWQGRFSHGRWRAQAFDHGPGRIDARCRSGC
jgi:hypothetical protein